VQINSHAAWPVQLKSERPSFSFQCGFEQKIAESYVSSHC